MLSRTARSRVPTPYLGPPHHSARPTNQVDHHSLDDQFCCRKFRIGCSVSKVFREGTSIVTLPRFVDTALRSCKTSQARCRACLEASSSSNKSSMAFGSGLMPEAGTSQTSTISSQQRNNDILSWLSKLQLCAALRQGLPGLSQGNAWWV